jgi:hypothetical protein
LSQSINETKAQVGGGLFMKRLNFLFAVFAAVLFAQSAMAELWVGPLAVNPTIITKAGFDIRGVTIGSATYAVGCYKSQWNNLGKASLSYNYVVNLGDNAKFPVSSTQAMQCSSSGNADVMTTTPIQFASSPVSVNRGYDITNMQFWAYTKHSFNKIYKNSADNVSWTFYRGCRIDAGNVGFWSEAKQGCVNRCDPQYQQGEQKLDNGIVAYKICADKAEADAKKCPSGATGEHPDCKCASGFDYDITKRVCNKIIVPKKCPAGTKEQGNNVPNGGCTCIAADEMWNGAACVKKPATCPSDATGNPPDCTCKEGNKTYVPEDNKCILKSELECDAKLLEELGTALTTYKDSEEIVAKINEILEMCKDSKQAKFAKTTWSTYKTTTISTWSKKQASQTKITDTWSAIKGNSTFSDGNKSHWTNAEGKFNTARLASDSIAGVVLGTASGLITSHVIKKNQIKKGYEDISCNVGGQRIADYGDEFVVGIQ